MIVVLLEHSALLFIELLLHAKPCIKSREKFRIDNMVFRILLVCLYVCECVLETEGNLGEGGMFFFCMYSCLRPEIQCKDLKEEIMLHVPMSLLNNFPCKCKPFV